MSTSASAHLDAMNAVYKSSADAGITVPSMSVAVSAGTVGLLDTEP